MMAGSVDSVGSRAPCVFATAGQTCVCLLPSRDWMPTKAVRGGGKGRDLDTQDTGL